ncbi:MAG: amidophosphoribosyltransferase [Lachnospiraceae bacterium]|jgi:amidophosphoribosyltransferase|nr:amidophosphoribosyltransferase [Lachnospiraceae bacterium]MCI9602214.1 amidophosphoribosyltransferase [Lachnospiraceae bacterium]MDE6894652.1 amidophosphoribosyltransferase [Lachnospiraceae bacterium]
MDRTAEERIKEECGVFGIFNPDGTEAASTISYGLASLQHRGQESCGIAVCDTEGPKGNMNVHKGMGLVHEVLKEKNLAKLKGNLGVGHVRYSTTGAAVLHNAQPLVLNYIKGTLALAHNGNLVNTEELREELARTGAIFQTTTDSEVIAYEIARARVHTKTVEEAIRQTASRIKGAYGIVIASPRKLIGVRDPLGLKPLCLGKKGDSCILASESCALSAVGAQFVRDILPGEIVTISRKGIFSDLHLQQEQHAHCIFEYIYFARLDSTLDKIPVYTSRKKAGAALAKAWPAEADLVTGVPDSGITAAQGYAEESGIPFGPAFYKNSYVGRTFIKPAQKEREAGVRLKLSVLKQAVHGKDIVLVDDSIVRGTTISNLIRLLKQAGAGKVHVRISSPPFLYPCYFGTDIPSNRQLLAASHSTEEIRQLIGADSLGYMRVEDLPSTVDGLPLCTACFDGHYPMEL